MARPYDPQKDEYYYPDYTPDLYLADDQIEKALKKIKISGEPAEKETQSVVRQIETLHRKVCLGKLNHNDFIVKCDHISDKFVKKFGYWHSETKTYKEFYKHFGN